MNDFALKIMHSFSEKISIRSVWNTRAKIDTVLLAESQIVFLKLLSILWIEISSLKKHD